MRTTLLLLLATSACKLPELTMPRRLIDLDEDGYTEAEGDCEPLNTAIHPGADEVCDNQDNNCDSQIDEDGALDAPTWYRDGDNDGYGDPNHYMTACDLPEGFVSNDEDCDDERQDVAPGLSDGCDGTDNDCDGVWDEDASPVWYFDQDGDGFGEPSEPDCRSTSQPAGYADNHDDCNDGNSEVNPGATEFCNQNDDDCNGTPDNDAFDAPTWCADSDGDSHGTPLETQSACQQPAVGDYIADCSDCDDGNAGVGGPDACRFPEEWTLSDDGVAADAELQGGAYSVVGWSLAVVNLDNNAYKDLLVGYRDGGVGRVAVVPGTGTRPAGASDLADVVHDVLSGGGNATAEFGTSIQVFPDVNGDGVKEILVGDPAAERADNVSTGVVYAFLSQTGGTYALQTQFVGVDYGDRTGERMALLPWFLGSNVSVATSAPEANFGTGVVFITGGLGGASGEVELSIIGSAITAEPDLEMAFGAGLASVWMADPWPALIVGAKLVPPGPTTDPRGMIFVFRGDPSAGLTYDYMNQAEVKITGEESSAGHFGSMVANAGDVNDDGYQDLLVGAPDFSSLGRTENGKVYLISGDLDNSDWSLNTLPAGQRIASFDGPEAQAHAGEVLAGMGNVDGDVYGDIAIGVPTVGTAGGPDSGSVYLFYGGPTLGGTHDLIYASEAGRARFNSNNGYDALGQAVTLNGSVDGDPYDDLIIGAHGDQSSTGTAYILFGEGF
ncbi:MAG: FG-GAP repeat protein [Deltaproteobacteria bacterium]|nr:FG-GAP repeat protein [Deltaproteobacteria bacterium]